MCRFICEVRRQDGSPYPAMSLKNLYLGILRYLKEEYKRFDLNFMDTDNAQFSRLRATLDGQMKKLNSEGVGNVVKQAKRISPLEEEKLWETGTFGIDNSESLFNTVYFYNCKIFGLRAADEHSSLRVDQFVFGKDDEGEFVDFLGGTCKNNQGGLKQRGKVRFRRVRQYVQESNPRCYVKVLREYIESIPLRGPFYPRPLSARDGANVGYSHQKFGLYTFEKLFKKICDKAGITGHHTGHSGKVRTATRLFHNKVDEQRVQERTGHRSPAVRAYTRTSETQQKEISDLPQPPKPKESKIEPKTSPPKSPVASCILPDKSDAKPVTIKCTKRNGDSFEIMF